MFDNHSAMACATANSVAVYKNVIIWNNFPKMLSKGKISLWNSPETIASYPKPLFLSHPMRSLREYTNRKTLLKWSL